MTITLDLPQELESALSIKANQFGVSFQEYLLHVLYSSLVGNKLKTGAELVECWQDEDLIGARPDISDSQAHARQIRDQAETLPHDGFPGEEPANESDQSVMAMLRKIKISASPDFSMKVDLYEPEGRDA